MEPHDSCHSHPSHHNVAAEKLLRHARQLVEVEVEAEAEA